MLFPAPGPASFTPAGGAEGIRGLALLLSAVEEGGATISHLQPEAQSRHLAQILSVGPQEAEARTPAHGNHLA